MRFLFRWRMRARLDDSRTRMIAETSWWLTQALARPEMAVRIPTVRAGKARFPRSLTRSFWDAILSDS
jgi:hypothetical protein